MPKSNKKMTLVELEATLEPMLSAIYGKYAHCCKGARFLYVWWGEGYSVWEQRYTKKQAIELINYFRPIMEMV
jgi:hypothetical protein